MTEPRRERKVVTVAFMQLHAAEQLIGSGERTEADIHLRNALAFYRAAGATRDVREAEALLRESA